MIAAWPGDVYNDSSHAWHIPGFAGRVSGQLCKQADHNEHIVVGGPGRLYIFVVIPLARATVTDCSSACILLAGAPSGYILHMEMICPVTVTYSTYAGGCGYGPLSSGVLVHLAVAAVADVTECSRPPLTVH